MDGNEGENANSSVTREENMRRISKCMDSSREEWKGSKNEEDNDFRKAKAIWMDSFRTIVIKIKLFMRLTPYWRWYQETHLN